MVPQSTRRPVAIDLFAGAGGLSLGFEMAGFDVIAAVEYDPVHAATHAFNFPKAPVLCKDIRKVSGQELVDVARAGWSLHNPSSEPWDGIVDVLIGGPSCQGFSAMGKQAVGDDRNELIGEFVRMVEELRPRAFVMENVPGILATQFKDLVGDAVERFEGAGYTLGNYRETLDATSFGVPQRRKRVVFVGVAGKRAPEPVSPTFTLPVTVSEALAGLPELLQRSQGDGELMELNEDQYLHYVHAQNRYLDILHKSSTKTQEYSRVLSGCLVTEHRDATVKRFEELAQGKTDPVSRTWRLVEGAPARTLRAGTGRERGAFSAARPLHPKEPRVISVREAARLHSFPDWFRFHSTNWHGHRQIGNAVPPLLANAVAISVMRSLQIHSEQNVRERRVLANPDVGLLSMNLSQAALHFKAATTDIPRTRQRALVLNADVPSERDPV
jgi:DNA (cytosine-5)-methyltransferase 1